MIESRLLKQHGVDTGKDLGIKTFCARPFDTVLIDSSGSCFLCECASWLPVSAGNIQVSSLDGILESHRSRELRESILDGSYRYCNNKHCAYLLDDRPTSHFPPRPAEPIIRHIRLAIDDSCNLSCPSCRIKKIFVGKGDTLKRRMGMIDKVIDYIRGQTHQINVHIGSDGDPFASLVYRYFMRRSSCLHNVTLTLQTNGLLIGKMYQRHRDIFDRLAVLNISMDGATPETYQSLRRGAKWSDMMHNLSFVGEIKQQHSFEVRLHFVVQAKNFREMSSMIDLADQHHVDRLYFNRITDWLTYTDFAAENIHDPVHPEHAEYLSVLEHIRDKIANRSDQLVMMPTIGHFSGTN